MSQCNEQIFQHRCVKDLNMGYKFNNGWPLSASFEWFLYLRLIHKVCLFLWKNNEMLREHSLIWALQKTNIIWIHNSGNKDWVSHFRPFKVGERYITKMPCSNTYKNFMFIVTNLNFCCFSKCKSLWIDDSQSGLIAPRFRSRQLR